MERANTSRISPRSSSGRNPDGFSLVEVVAATGILALALVAVLGLITATVHSAAEVTEAASLARLNESIQGELERLQANLGYGALAGLVPRSDSRRSLRLTATRNGLRAACLDPADPAADRPLDDPTVPGIANRDRYFLVELTQLPGLEWTPDSGFLALGARISWPYQLAIGPATPGALEWDTDPAREVPANERSRVIFNFALRP